MKLAVSRLLRFVEKKFLESEGSVRVLTNLTSSFAIRSFAIRSFLLALSHIQTR